MERIVYVRYGLSPVHWGLSFAGIKVALGVLQKMGGLNDLPIMLGRRASRGCAGSRRRRARLRRSRLRVKNYR